jgi:uncharacterized protein
VRLTPRARTDHIDGIAVIADGSHVLKVSVTAQRAENRANGALITLLAKEWRLPRRGISIVGGGKSRTKTVHVAGEPHALLQRLTTAIAVLPIT